MEAGEVGVGARERGYGACGRATEARVAAEERQSRTAEGAGGERGAV